MIKKLLTLNSGLVLLIRTCTKYFLLSGTISAESILIYEHLFWVSDQIKI